MAYANDGLQETSTQPPLQSRQPRHSLFYVVATVLGVNMFPSASHPSRPYGEPQPSQTSHEVLANRFPYEYYQSLSG
ncbi:MAG: hypothetical protein OEU26_12930 [Candidatus Tectomicrobia bacterium]|nr:hypothetical protein [Candidatus Tectomicrobia bacterium]